MCAPRPRPIGKSCPDCSSSSGLSFLVQKKAKQSRFNSFLFPQFSPIMISIFKVIHYLQVPPCYLQLIIFNSL